MYLKNNKISKIEGLDTLETLFELHLDGNKISEIEGLDKMVKMWTLSLKNNKIVNLGKRLDNLGRLTCVYL